MGEIPQVWVECAIKAIRSRREYQAGVAFGVPSDARDQHDEALARAVLAAALPDVRRAVAEEIANDDIDAVAALGFRLEAIAWAHRKPVDEHGGTLGYCAECGEEWPCPTYLWAMDPTITETCAWGADECAHEGHDHVASVLYGADREAGDPR